MCFLIGVFCLSLPIPLVHLLSGGGGVVSGGVSVVGSVAVDTDGLVSGWSVDIVGSVSTSSGDVTDDSVWAKVLKMY